MDHNESKYQEVSEILKALGHPVRLCILKNLMAQHEAKAQPSNVTYMQHCLEIPQSTLSQHLQKLRLAGVISGKKNGLEVTYEIADPRIMTLLKIFFNA